jgi:hypothetical protein
LLSIFLALLISGYLILSVDNNPAKIDFIKGSAEIKNKYDKLLWSKTNTNFGDVFNNISGLGLLLGRVIDINKDGENEVLLAQIHNSVERDPNIYLFNAQGEEIWKYFHVDTVETIEERFSNTFLIKGIIDTIHNRNVIELLVYFQHENYYPSGILKLDLKTGKRIGEVLWHPGAFGGAALLDWNKDGKKEIIAVGASNGMKRAFLFSIDHDKLKGTFPTAKNYQFLNVDLAAFNNYILFPQSDYSQYFFPKYNAALGIPHIIDSLISVSVHEGKANLIEADFRYDIRFNENLKPNYVVIGDEFIVHRDKLINEGILNPPYTDTDEFRENILNNIEYWNGEKFVKFKSN